MAQPPQRARPVVVRGRIRDEFQCPITAQILRLVMVVVEAGACVMDARPASIAHDGTHKAD